MSVDLLRSQNQIGVFIFLLPQSTDGEAFFCSPMYQSLRQSVSTRCSCEFSVFDGNDFSQLNLCLPAGHRNHNNKGNNNCSNRSASISSAAIDSPPAHSGLLLRVSNSYEQLLIARGNWIVQVVYKTVPSLHHLFLRLVGQYCTALSSSGYRRPSGSWIMRSQGFKYTVLAAITHSRIEEMRRQQSEYSLMDDLAYDSPVKSQREPVGGQDNGLALMSAGGQNTIPPRTQKACSPPSPSVPSSTYSASSRCSNSTCSYRSPRERIETQKRNDGMMNSPARFVDETQKHRDDGANSPSRLADECFRSLTSKQEEYLTALRQQYKEFFSPIDRRRGDDNPQRREMEYKEKNQLELDSEVDFSDSTNLDSLTAPIDTRRPLTVHQRDGFSTAEEDWRSGLGTFV